MFDIRKQNKKLLTSTVLVNDIISTINSTVYLCDFTDVNSVTSVDFLRRLDGPRVHLTSALAGGRQKTAAVENNVGNQTLAPTSLASICGGGVKGLRR